MISNSFVRWLKDKSGATAVEFAIVANIFILMLVGSFSAGYFFLIQSDLEESITAAERYAMIHDETDNDLKGVITGGLTSYKGSDVTMTFKRATSSGVKYVKINLSYKLKLTTKFGIPPMTISAVRIFPT